MDPIAVTAALLRNQLPEFTIREGATLMARVASKGETHAVIVIAGVPVTAKLPPEVPAGATLKLEVQEVTADRVTLRIAPQPAAKGAPAPPPAATPAPPTPATYAPPAGQAARALPTPPAQTPLPGQPAQPAPPGPAGQPGQAAQPGQAPQPGQPGPAHEAALPAAAQAAQPSQAAEQAQPAQAPAAPAAQNPMVGTFAAAMQLQPPKVEVEEPPNRRRGSDGEPADVVSLAFNSPTLGRLDLRLELRGERLLAEVTTRAGRPHAIASDGSERLRARLEAAGLETTVKIRPRTGPLDLYA